MYVIIDLINLYEFIKNNKIDKEILNKYPKTSSLKEAYTISLQLIQNFHNQYKKYLENRIILYLNNEIKIVYIYGNNDKNELVLGEFILEDEKKKEEFLNILYEKKEEMKKILKFKIET